MAEQTPQPVNPAVNPQAEDAPSTAVPVAEIDTSPAPVAPATNPEVPQPAPEQAVALAPPPDEAFLEEQTAQENRWIQAAATNPDGINRNGSVVIDRGGGVTETINRDGSYEISSGSGTVRYDAAGQQTSYTTPTVNGLSQTYTTDGVVVETFQQGGLRTESISYNGALVSTNTTLQTGDVTLQQIQVGEGPPVNAAITRVPIEGTAGLQITQAQVGDGEIVTSTLDLEQRRLDRLAADEVRANAADQLRQDIRASQAQVESGIPLSATQLAAIEEQAQALEAAEAAVVQADEALAEADPTVVAADTDPQVTAPANQDPIPAFDTTEFAPAPVDPANDAAVAEVAAAQEEAEFVPVADIDTGPAEVSTADDPSLASQPSDAVPAADIDTGPAAVTTDEEILAFEEQQQQSEFVAVADIDTGPAEVTEDEEILSFEEAQEQAEFVPVADIDTAAADVDPADNPEVPQPADDLPDAFVYDAADAIELEDDPIILAQADNIATDVALVDVTGDAIPVDSDLDPTVPQPVEPVSEGGFYGEPTPVGGNFTASYNPETGTYDVVDIDTGEIVDSGLSQQQATLAAQEFSLGDPQFPNETADLAAESDLIREPTDVDVAEAQFVETDTGFFELREEAPPQPDEFGFVETEGGLFVQQDEIEAQIDQEQFENELGAEEFVPLSEIEDAPEPVLASDAAEYGADAEAEGTVTEFTADGPVTRDAGEATAEAARIEAQRQNLRNQQSIREQRGNNVDSADWRVRLRLAPQARYLYLDDTYGPGILQPLAVSDGIIFPYTPTINTVYKADYTPYNLTHSNYRGFFYQSSYVEDINITGTFTAQDSVEAAYLLAVIHFFRSATKMFYGQDPNRGAPPPLVYLSAFGAYQYVDAPCVISQFNYNLPADVDYIRARAPNIDGTNLLKRRDRQSLPTNAFSAALQRLRNARPGGLPLGGQRPPPAPPTLGLGSPTYVPTKIDITIVLHPMQSRKQVSQQFSVREYGPGRLTPKGFW